MTPSRVVARTPFILFAASFLAFGCFLAAPAFHLSDDAPKSSDFKRVILLPMNFDHTPSPALAPGVELMGERIRSYLESRGYEVVTPRMSTTIALWKKCTKDVGGIANEDGKELNEERYGLARAELVRRTVSSFPADGVVAAAIVVREGRYSGRNLRWDGVARRVLFSGESNYPILRLNGKAPGTSLRTSVFDREGRNIFERYVGLETMIRFELNHVNVEGVPRDDLFLDEALIEEGIAMSFQPWLLPASIGAK